MTEYTGFTAENNSKFEPWLLEKVCEPILDRIPARFHPNTISIINHAVMWSAFVALAAAPYLNGYNTLGARVWGGLGIIAVMILDCLDGMHARRTHQCSRTGAVLDHWFDALNAPLTAAGVLLTLELDPLTVVLVLGGTCILYNCQLVIYHHTKRFIHTPTSGTEGQLMTAAAVLVLAVVLYIFPRDLRWVGVLCLGSGWFAVLLQAKVIWYYVPYLKGLWRQPVGFIALIAALGALHLAGLISALALVLGMVFLSFRINGSYVLYTVLRKPYSGSDFVLVIWLVAILVASLVNPFHFHGGYTIEMLVPYLGILYISSVNLYDLARHLPELKEPEPSRVYSS